MKAFPTGEHTLARCLALASAVTAFGPLACWLDKDPSDVEREGSEVSGLSPKEGRLEPSEVDRSNASRFAKQPARTDWSGGDAEAGRRVYQDTCWVCHGTEAKGWGPAADTINPKPRDFREGRFYIDADDDGRPGGATDLARVILVGAGAFGGSEIMQGWHETLSTKQVKDLVAYLQSLASEAEEGS